MPLWMVTYFAVLIVGLFSIIEISFGSNLSSQLPRVLFVVSVLLFLARDLMIFSFFNLAKNNKRANLTALLYLLILYVIIPSIFFASDLKDLAYLFVPRSDFIKFQNTVDYVEIILPSIVHFGLAVILLKERLSKLLKGDLV